MQTIETQSQLISSDNTANRSASSEKTNAKTPLLSSENLTFQLGLWFSGLESFLKLYSSDLVKENYRSHDWSKEFRLTRSVLQKCSKLAIDFSQQIVSGEYSSIKGDKFELIDDSDSSLDYESFSVAEILQLSLALKEAVLFSEALLRSDSLGFHDWTVWSKSLIGKLKGIDVAQKLIRTSEREGGKFLPEPVRALLASGNAEPRLLSDLNIVLPQFAKVLKCLNVVENMLNEDKPLKASLLLFAKINEQMREMMDYINNRLMRYPDEKDPLFGSLDSAAYTASIELRKVYNQELRELIEIRPTPVVFAKIENSFALLNDSLQLTLVNFAQLVDPELKSFDIFPVLKIKEEQSIVLREEMWGVLQSVKEAEKNPEEYPIDSLNEQLLKFSDIIIGLLFYKDIETVQRFIEEVLRTKDKKDLVPTLHRFGAYLETLLGQVNMRAALVDHPFAPLEREPQDMFG